MFVVARRSPGTRAGRCGFAVPFDAFQSDPRACHFDHQSEVRCARAPAIDAGARSGSGIGVLSLIALTFSDFTQALAADPDVTFLDDDSVSYKDLAHGAFEIVTKEDGDPATHPG